jgi:hypothetical protein
MKKMPVIIISLLTVIILSACNLPVTIIINSTPDANQLATDVAATLNAVPQGSTVQVIPSLTSNFTPTLTLTPLPEPGSLQGTVTYPYGAIPRLVIAAYMQNGTNYSYVINEAGESFYSMDTPYLIPGQWLVVAYDSVGNSGGCTNPVTILPNTAATCNITDWVSAYPPKRAGIPNP